MRLKDYFGPKWRHSDPEIRLTAVEALNDSDLATLREVVESDADPKVRLAALGKIIDEDTLAKVASANSDEAVRLAATRRLQNFYFGGILAAHDEHQALPLLEKLTDQNLMAEVACQSSHQAVRAAAVARVEQAALLVKITQANCGLKAGMAVLEKVCDLDTLKLISQSASNKKIVKAAEQKFDTLRVESDPDYRMKLVTEELSTACQRFENTIDEGAGEAVGQVRGDTEALFDQLDPNAVHPLRKRLSAMCQQLDAIIEQREQRKIARSTLERLCSEAAELSVIPEQDVVDQTAAKKLADLVQTWAAVDTELLPAPDYQVLQRKFDTAREAFQQRIDDFHIEANQQRQSMEKIEALLEEIESLAQAQNPEEVQGKWERLSAQWQQHFAQRPEPNSLQERFSRAQTVRERCQATFAAEHQERSTGEAKRLALLCEVMEAAAQSPDKKGILRKVRSARKEWRKLGRLAPEAKQDLADRFKAADDKFDEQWAEVLEIRKWEQWANLKKKEELCEAIEALAAHETLDGLARRTRQAQQQWRTIGAVERAHSDPVWQRFLSACDAVYHRCLQRKIELNEQVHVLVESEDIPAAAGQIQALQKEWNRIGPLPRTMEKELHDSFREACNGFFEKRRAAFNARDEQYRENLQRKQAICQAAESVADSTDWVATAKQLKNLQRQWKEIGPVSQKQSGKIWRRFRSACDAFFQRFEGEKPNNLAQKEALCHQVEQLVADLDDDSDGFESVARELMDIQKHWKAIGPVPDESADTVWQRFSTTCDAFFERRNERLAKLKIERGENREKKENLILQAESLVGASDFKTTAEALKELQKQWQEIGSAGWKTDKLQWQKFRGACDSFFERRQTFYNEKDHMREENQQRKEASCLTVEMLIRLLVPDATIEALDSVSPAEQLNMAMALKSEVILPDNQVATWKRAMDKVKKIQTEWRQIGPVPARVDSVLWQRFKAALDQFYGLARQRRTERSSD
jgi:Domain of Unknown Function (DUF349)